MNEDQIREIQVEQANLKRDYQAMKGPGMEHLLQWLIGEQRSAKATADKEMDNTTRKSLYCQKAYTYETVMTHLARMLEDEQTVSK